MSVGRRPHCVWPWHVTKISYDTSISAMLGRQNENWSRVPCIKPTHPTAPQLPQASAQPATPDTRPA